MLAALLPVAAPSSLRKSFAGPFVMPFAVQSVGWRLVVKKSVSLSTAGSMYSFLS